MIKMNYLHGRMHVWRKNGDVLSYRCTKPTMKSVQMNAMVWSCISSDGPGKIIILEEKITSQVYLKLMQEVIIPEGKRLIGNDFILQQDNAPIHTAKIVMKFITDSNIQYLLRKVLTFPL